jgi:Cytochrome c554 and c-prime
MNSRRILDFASALIRETRGRLLIACMFGIAHGSLFSIAPAADSAFVGSQSCTSVSCHGRAEPRRVAGGVGGASLQEFVLYERHDPHAQAAKTLASPEYQAILRRLSERKGESSNAEVLRQCAQCHDPEGVAAAGHSGEQLLSQEPGQGLSMRGIRCESCHGGGKDWLASHYQRDVSRSSLLAAGMRDTKDLQVRGQLCASCHVGSAERNVNHDMLAAGHPPLRFELAAYHRKLTSHDESGKRSHWNDTRERMSTPDFEVKLWEAGQLASAKAALALLEGRAHRAALAIKESNTPDASWPEFAEYDCMSCHQRLRPAERNRKTASGLPVWTTWNFGFVTASAEVKELNSLRAEMQRFFSSQPSAVEVQARNAGPSLIPSLPREVASSSQLLQLLERQSDGKRSWESLCQRYLAQRVVEKATGDEFQKLELAGSVSAFQRAAFNQQRDAIDRDLEEIGHSLSFVDEKLESPRVLATPQGIEKVESDLAAAAGKLRMLQSFLQQQ